MTADSERQIRELLETRTRAFGRRDAATAAAGYDDDLVLYDVVGPFVRRGEDPTGRSENWIEPISGSATSWSGSAARCGDGTEVGMWVRATSCLRRQDGAWTTVHEPASVPFDADSGQAVLRGEL